MSCSPLPRGHGRRAAVRISPPNSAKAVVTIHGRNSGDSIRGTFTYKIYDLQGHLLFGNGVGTFMGRRFRAAG